MNAPGWRTLSVGQLAADEAGALTDGPFGSNLKSEHYTDSGPRVVRLQNIGCGVFVDERAHISGERFQRLSKHTVKSGDVLVAMLGDRLPRACLAPEALGPAIVKADCARLRVNEAVASSRFVMHLLNSPVAHKAAADLVHGVGRPRLGLGILRSLELPVADRLEQDRIVAAIESHFSRLDAATATLERVQRNLERYRASVLKAAVEGRLVPTEAELARKEGRSYEPASVLLKRILAERRRRWEEAELAKLKAKGKAPTDDRWKARYVEPVEPDTAGLPVLPEGWCWASPGQFFAWTSGSFLPKKAQRGGSIPVLGGNGVSGSHDEALVLTPTIVVGRVGAHCGNIHVTDGAVWITDNAIYAAEGCEYAVLPFWRIVMSTQNLNANAGGTGQPYVNQNHLNDLVVPLAPESEQHRIVQEVDRLLSQANCIALACQSSATRCARLLQSILKWAFEGRLVNADLDGVLSIASSQS